MVRKETIQLADDKTYTLSTLNVGDMIAVEDKFGSLTVDATNTKMVIYWLWLSLKHEHKEMTLEQLYELIDAPFIASGKMNNIFEVMSRLNGWDKPSKNVESPVEEKKQD